MPVIIDAEFEDGTKQHVRIPSEIWRKDNLKVTKLLMTEKPIKSLVLDPRLETADVELENNYFPRRIMKSRFDVYKSSRWGSGGNPMKTDLNRKKASKKPVKSGQVSEETKKPEAGKSGGKKSGEKKPAAKKPAAKKPAAKKPAAKKGKGNE